MSSLRLWYLTAINSLEMRNEKDIILHSHYILHMKCNQIYLKTSNAPFPLIPLTRYLNSRG